MGMLFIRNLLKVHKLVKFLNEVVHLMIKHHGSDLKKFYSCKHTVHPLSQNTSLQFRKVCLPYTDDVMQLSGVISLSISTDHTFEL